VLEIKCVDLDSLFIVTIVKKNNKWEHVFKCGHEIVWRCNSRIGDQTVFEADSQLIKNDSTQNLCYLYDDGTISIDRDS